LNCRLKSDEVDKNIVTNPTETLYFAHSISLDLLVLSFSYMFCFLWTLEHGGVKEYAWSGGGQVELYIIFMSILYLLPTSLCWQE